VGARATVFPCTEAGVVAATAAGGGPHTFSCAGPTTIVTSAELVISQSVELDGGGLLTLSGGGTHRVISTSAGPVTLRNLTVRDGYAPPAAFGACIAGALTLENVEVTGCRHDGFGGAVAGGPLTLIDSHIHGNHTTGINGGDLVITRTRIRNNTGGGLRSGSPTFITESTISGNTAATDAGILIGNPPWGNAVISRSTISHNVAASAAGSGGLGVWSGADIDDSTFVGNLPVAVRGYQWDPGGLDTVVIRSSTLIGNAGPSTLVMDPPGPFSHGQVPVSATIENTILAGGFDGRINVNGKAVIVPDPADCGGLPSTGPGPVLCATKAELNLGKLGPHGGPTWTVPLKAPSVAIDAAAACTSATDQRGVARPFGAACDIGAFEWDGPAPGAVPALPWLGVAALFAALCLAGLWSLRGRRPA